MRITITLTVEMGRPPRLSYDIQAADTQKIRETLQVLKENLPALADIGDVKYVRDRENGRKIDVETTYEQAHIYSGAELILTC